MSNKIRIVFGGIVVSSMAMNTHAAVNVALNKNVTLVAGVANGDLGTITDGAFLPRGQQWQTGTVWWEGEEPTFQIDLGGVFEIDSAIAQVDDNDGYRLLYYDIAGDEWLTLWDVPNYDAFGNGMQTRPNPDDDSERFFFGFSVDTNAIRLVGVGGDSLFSASEIQVFEVPTPGAAMLAMLGTIVAVGGRRRH